MLFNSIAFIFYFLPLMLLAFFLSGRYSRHAAVSCMILGAVFFYGYWNPHFVWLLATSIVINYGFGQAIAICRNKGRYRSSTWVLTLAITVDLSILAWYKYANFFLEQYNWLAGSDYSMATVMLPLGISFFTFTQIAYLVDVYQDKVREYSFLYYFHFVTYFPHLIAGPIIHHREMIPQFTQPQTYRFNPGNFSVGMAIFCVGLFKKCIIADNLATDANLVFTAAAAGERVGFFSGWIGALEYTFQLYFDFSGYCDMAIGLSKMFNVLLPVNFNSPYRAANIIGFWRQWHITLSRFLRDYLYIPLGGNRQGPVRRYVNLFATMILGGLWHGASWTFIIWGALHGTFLTINHFWQNLMERWGFSALARTKVYRIFAWALTFLCVVVAWVFFRADSLQAATEMLKAMSGAAGVWVPTYYTEQVTVLNALQPLLSFFQTDNLEKVLVHDNGLYYLGLAAMIAFLMPNTQQIFSRFNPGLETYPGDIRPFRFSGFLRWDRVIKLRYAGFVWLSHAIIMLLMISFYMANLDVRVFHYFPTTERPMDEINNREGDFRSNLFFNDIFLGDENKVVIVGSSYTTAMNAFRFDIDGKPWKSGTVGMGGNSLMVGFRTALAVLETADITRVKTMIFGVSPLGFGKLNAAYIPWKEQCTSLFGKIGFQAAEVPFSACQPIALNASDVAHMMLNPGDARYYQFHGFLNKLQSTFQHAPKASGTKTQTPLTKTVMQRLDAQYARVRNASQHPYPGNPQNGNNKDFHWEQRDILASMEQDGDVYRAFQQLQELAKKKHVQLYVYNSPTVSSASADHIYPEQFLETYEARLAQVMGELNIPYYDFQHDYVWDGRYAIDFIHLIPWARHRIHAKLIEKIYPGAYS